MSVIKMNLNGRSSTVPSSSQLLPMDEHLQEASMSLPTLSFAPSIAPTPHTVVCILQDHVQSLSQQLSMAQTKYEESYRALESVIQKTTTAKEAIQNLKVVLEHMKQLDNRPLRMVNQGVETTGALSIEKSTQIPVDSCDSEDKQRGIVDQEQHEYDRFVAEKKEKTASDIISGMDKEGEQAILPVKLDFDAGIVSPPAQTPMKELWMALDEINRTITRILENPQDDPTTKVEDLQTYVDEQASKYYKLIVIEDDTSRSADPSGQQVNMDSELRDA
ncbi:hypothetical protein GALMADRAFT_148573 [Galerina marginata CBS 339.88]|uniref:Uncharacterized protein n=1 Tax=Galerina marginata (strain CBS 339.88) TaxID=685588 RepID=A0A067S6P8_GALM3|nr:hypothetical protein GALMADRAFT_148573 [Galerina marginata CBS 339.88]